MIGYLPQLISSTKSPGTEWMFALLGAGVYLVGSVLAMHPTVLEISFFGSENAPPEGETVLFGMALIIAGLAVAGFLLGTAQKRQLNLRLSIGRRVFGFIGISLSVVALVRLHPIQRSLEGLQAASTPPEIATVGQLVVLNTSVVLIILMIWTFIPAKYLAQSS